MEVSMIVVILLSAFGFEPGIPFGTDCAEALHMMRTKHNMELIATEQMPMGTPDDGDHAIAFVLTEAGDHMLGRPHLGTHGRKRTAIMHCGFEIEIKTE